MLKQGQTVVLLLSQTSLVKQQLIPQSDAPVPAGLVGTWTGTSPQATDISFTVDADGNITSKANFNVDYEPYRQSSTTAKSCSNFWKSLRLGGWRIFLPCFLVLQEYGGAGFSS